MRFFQDIHSVGDLIKKIKEYQSYILVVIGIGAVLSGSLYGYFYFKQSREEGAYRALVLAMEYFDASIKQDDSKDENDFAFLDKKEFKSHVEKWEKVESVFKSSYENHRSSGIAPIFLAFQAEALVQLGKRPEAIKVLRTVVSLVGTQEVKAYYQSKLALLLIDTKNPESVEEGVGILKKIALDDQSVAHDMVLFHLGNYYWYTNKFAEARNYWNQLLLKYGKEDDKYPSPWVSVAKEKLRLIDNDVE